MIGAPLTFIVQARKLTLQSSVHSNCSCKAIFIVKFVAETVVYVATHQACMLNICEKSSRHAILLCNYISRIRDVVKLVRKCCVVMFVRRGARARATQWRETSAWRDPTDRPHQCFTILHISTRPHQCDTILHNLTKIYTIPQQIDHRP